MSMELVDIYGLTARLHLARLTGGRIYEDGHLQRKTARVLYSSNANLDHPDLLLQEYLVEKCRLRTKNMAFDQKASFSDSFGHPFLVWLKALLVTFLDFSFPIGICNYVLVWIDSMGGLILGEGDLKYIFHRKNGVY
ncbi:hypothetical protein HAX54_005429 [Datura stramonium]|uniref:Uncharacterized protein n=1 Tax=Datura stramonium TaxID=4076 RepID=A0ABS8T8Q3_DATST|nr:hypothetical protein [Datura stramonium]